MLISYPTDDPRIGYASNTFFIVGYMTFISGHLSVGFLSLWFDNVFNSTSKYLSCSYRCFSTKPIIEVWPIIFQALASLSGIVQNRDNTLPTWCMWQPDRRSLLSYTPGAEYMKNTLKQKFIYFLYCQQNYIQVVNFYFWYTKHVRREKPLRLTGLD